MKVENVGGYSNDYWYKRVIELEEGDIQDGVLILPEDIYSVNIKDEQKKGITKIVIPKRFGMIKVNRADINGTLNWIQNYPNLEEIVFEDEERTESDSSKSYEHVEEVSSPHFDCAEEAFKDCPKLKKISFPKKCVLDFGYRSGINLLEAAVVDPLPSCIKKQDKKQDCNPIMDPYMGDGIYQPVYLTNEYQIRDFMGLGRNESEILTDEQGLFANNRDEADNRNGNATLKEENEALKNQNADLTAENEGLRAEIDGLKGNIEKMRRIIGDVPGLFSSGKTAESDKRMPTDPPTDPGFFDI